MSNCEDCDAKDREIDDIRDDLKTAREKVEELEADLAAYKKADSTASNTLFDALSSLQDAIGYVNQAQREVG